MIKAKKSLGQNFLIDKNVLERITNTTNIKNKIILEIGPGTGNLTSYILKKNPKKMIVIEKDIELARNLKNKFNNQLIIINDDVLKIDETKLFKDRVIVFGNLPYNISTEILSKWIINLKNNFWFESLVLMFQKEVAERIVAKPGSKNYGRLSILTNWLTESSKLFDIPSEAFIPKPKVKSSVIQLKPLSKPLYDVSFESLEKITHLAFSQKRKMLKTSLKEIDGEKILEDLNISPNLRPENLSVIDFCKIAKKSNQFKN